MLHTGAGRGPASRQRQPAMRGREKPAIRSDRPRHVKPMPERCLPALKRH
jgi:hypothetical protein